MRKDKKDTLMIVCGQGTYKNTRFYSEFPEKNAYLGHILKIPEKIQTYRPDYVIFSGGYTQKETGSKLSESESIPIILREKLNIRFDHQFMFYNSTKIHYLREISALDSVENILYSIFKYRISSGKNLEDIKKIYIYSTWSFKKKRFLMASNSLGIKNKVQFLHYSQGKEITNLAKALQSEKEIIRKLKTQKDCLMRGQDWETKRRNRFQGKDYFLRDKEYRSQFPRFFKQLDEIEIHYKSFPLNKKIIKKELKQIRILFDA